MTADAPLLLAGGRFPTGGPEVDAVLIRQGVIAGLGRHADLRAELPPDGVVHDLAGATVWLEADP